MARRVVCIAATTSLVIGVGVALCPPAFDADMRVKAPIVEAVYDWTGFYFGGNVGYGVGHNVSQMTGVTANATRDSFILAPDGVIGGGQIGYNW